MVQPLFPAFPQDDDKPAQRLSEHQIEAESSLKPGDKTDEALSVHRGAIRVPSPNPSLISIDDANVVRLGRNPDYAPIYHEEYALRSSAPPRTLKEKIDSFWTTNKGLAYVLLAQFFGNLMNVTTRILEMEGNSDSLMYLPLADATVITFLSPSLACWACSYFINEPFTRMEQIAAYISLFGVVLIARPVSLFSALSHSSDPVPPASGGLDAIPSNVTATSPDRLAADYDDVTPTQRAAAVGVAMLGVIGSTGAYTTIRWIGKRAHPLISVTYFATWCTIVSVVAMAVMPGVGFLLPKGVKDWSYLLFLGICGFVMQFLLAAGLQYEKSSRATNMLYMQMFFALGFDKLIWGTTPSALSIVGSSLILGSAIYVAMNKEEPKKNVEPVGRGDSEEERGLMSPVFDTERRDDDDADIQMRPLR
ncbi:hypothetical protein J4E81_010247 [Alternaria sp. BMP 2799]|uniref:uncharacterized protein n=1 Tax=Alternaria viburni TaxID=566460 RepID=UPI0020C2C3A3|nr:uncharacterized protein J4E79_006640 [Alternaria viburni]KAI4658881.1 hypothetical protein J4E79_006640 [Alternaria viburni]KAI4679843.1 hypothetical protein J4E81_010247 [Alternaria sp. BMP 2799]